MKRGDVKNDDNNAGVESLEGSIAAVTKAGGTLIMPKDADSGRRLLFLLRDPGGDFFRHDAGDVTQSNKAGRNLFGRGAYSWRVVRVMVTAGYNSERPKQRVGGETR